MNQQLNKGAVEVLKQLGGIFYTLETFDPQETDDGESYRRAPDNLLITAIRTVEPVPLSQLFARLEDYPLYETLTSKNNAGKQRIDKLDRGDMTTMLAAFVSEAYPYCREGANGSEVTLDDIAEFPREILHQPFKQKVLRLFGREESLASWYELKPEDEEIVAQKSMQMIFGLHAPFIETRRKLTELVDVEDDELEGALHRYMEIAQSVKNLYDRENELTREQKTLVGRGYVAELNALYQDFLDRSFQLFSALYAESDDALRAIGLPPFLLGRYLGMGEDTGDDFGILAKLANQLGSAGPDWKAIMPQAQTYLEHVHRFYTRYSDLRDTYSAGMDFIQTCPGQPEVIARAAELAQTARDLDEMEYENARLFWNDHGIPVSEGARSAGLAQLMACRCPLLQEEQEK